MKENREHTKALWDEFRFGKCYPNTNEFLLRVAGFNRPLKPLDFLPEYNAEQPYYGAPKPGSQVYIEMIEPPDWFVRGLVADGLVMDEDALATLRSAGMKRKNGRVRDPKRGPQIKLTLRVV